MEGFAEPPDVVAWWSQLLRSGLPVGSLFGQCEGVLDGVDGFAGGLLGEVAVDVGRGGQGGVAQGLGDHGERHAGGDGDGGGQVAQIVNGHPGNTRFVGEFPEPVQNGAGPQWPAVAPAEDQPSEGGAWVAVGAAAAGGELAGDEGADVPVPEIVQVEAAEGGDEIVVHVVAVAGHGRRLEHQRFGRQPGVQVVGDGLVRVGVESACLAFQEGPQGGLGGVVAGEAASPDGRPPVVWGGDVDGEGPRPVVMVGEQAGQRAPSWRRWLSRQPHLR